MVAYKTFWLKRCRGTPVAYSCALQQLSADDLTEHCMTSKQLCDVTTLPLC